MTVLTKVYKPSMNVGQVYARPYGSAIAPIPIGNVLELSLEHEEDVQTQEDLTQQGGGVHAEVRRVKAIKTKMKIADINVVNLARAVMGTAEAVSGGTVTDEPLVVTLGGLLRLKHLAPTALTLKKGADASSATAFTTAADYEVRPEGVFVYPGAAELQEGDKLWVSYTYGEYAVIEALTAKAAELELTFGGLNEADSGNPVLVEIFRASQGVTKALALLGKGFGALDVEGSVMQDPSRTGQGISKYYRTSMV
ncbi:MAG: hypothetical protein RSD57_14530 [Comamonas sp.]